MPLPRPRTLCEFQDRVLCLCALFMCSETSGARTVSRNEQVGGAPASRHLLDFGSMARDLVPDDNTEAQRAEVCRAARALGLVALDEGNHVHVHALPAGASP